MAVIRPVKIGVEQDGRVVIIPVTLDVAELAGALPRPAKAISLEDMEKTIRQRGSRY